MKQYTIIILLLAFALLNNCSDEKSTEPEKKAPQFPTPVTITAPQSANTPAKIDSAINSFNGFMNLAQTYLLTISQLQPSTAGNRYIWSLEFQATAIRIIAEPAANDNVKWQLYLTTPNEDGTPGQEHKVLEGNTNADGSKQTWYFYDEQTNQVASEMNIERSSDSVIITTKTSDSDLTQVITSNNDGTGKFQEYSGDKLLYEAIWNADGSGTYKQWNEIGGLIEEGSWQ